MTLTVYSWHSVFLVEVVSTGPGTLLLQALECFPLNILGLPDLEMRRWFPHDKNTGSS